MQLELCPERVEEDLTAHPRGVRERGAQGPLCSSLQDRGEAALCALFNDLPSALDPRREELILWAERPSVLIALERAVPVSTCRRPISCPPEIEASACRETKQRKQRKQRKQ